MPGDEAEHDDFLLTEGVVGAQIVEQAQGVGIRALGTERDAQAGPRVVDLGQGLGVAAELLVNQVVARAFALHQAGGLEGGGQVRVTPLVLLQNGGGRDAQRQAAGAGDFQPVGVGLNEDVGGRGVEAVGEGVGQQLAQHVGRVVAHQAAGAAPRNLVGVVQLYGGAQHLVQQLGGVEAVVEPDFLAHLLLLGVVHHVLHQQAEAQALALVGRAQPEHAQVGGLAVGVEQSEVFQQLGVGLGQHEGADFTGTAHFIHEKADFVGRQIGEVHVRHGADFPLQARLFVHQPAQVLARYGLALVAEPGVHASVGGGGHHVQRRADRQPQVLPTVGGRHDLRGR